MDIIFRIPCLLSCLTFFGILTSGLKNVEIEAPSYIRQGEEIVFRCNYDLEMDSLYAVKWYLDREEFYRYVPKEAPPQQIFLLPHGGMDVDVRFSNDHNVLLRNMSLEHSGVYKCVVSAESTFQTVEKSKYVRIVRIGYESPRVSLDQPNYHPGDEVRANCTLEKTFPRPNVTWTVNGRLQKPGNSGLMKMELTDQRDVTPAAVVSTINFTLPESFLPTSLLCRIQLFDLYDESAVKKIQPIPRRFSLRAGSGVGFGTGGLGNNVTTKEFNSKSSISQNNGGRRPEESGLTRKLFQLLVVLGAGNYWLCQIL